MVKVGIVGASGYTGLELVKMLVMHPGFELSYLATSRGDTMIEQLHPSLNGVVTMSVDKADIDSVIKHCDLVFLALPHKTSMGFAKYLIEAGLKVVDLSADYRLELETYEAYYCKHEDKTHLSKSVYALIEYYREELKNTNLAAGPGCYPTATLLGILPFIPYLDVSAPLFIDAKSGVSGAGKKLSNETHFVGINDNIFAYNPLKHRHAPEIAEKIEKIHGAKMQVNFVPHLIPATRGELVSIYATLKDDIDPLAVLKEIYIDDPFIRICEKPVDIKSTAGTHFCDIYAMVNGNTLFVSSAIDNLLRGASSQALVAANLMCGYDEGMGIPTIAYVP
ncbi:MAG: N-acetyl-gamma-glutamyl-phosphate reductase [Sulfurovum sp.]|nr:N-acetyl-gamma-glutamyl-phosphate reductase [Sulfurovum sp.]MCB4753834.1 N-acetyl-gamma-glutamyl-phosphate reductase [Sulfurovum sp.]MCB4754485.1 N-acetyl-gamma-glutamyl-phosphate reductase [Sulfurovum sp.]MCB4780503.1 N-acetyl-gamma-glutamyl-phosphate reductase [Sulfurovum sp.]